MEYLEPVDLSHPDLAELYDELPLWSAPFGLLLLDRVPLRSDLSILDVGAGSGFLTVELAQRCGSSAQVIAVDPWSNALRRLRRKVEYLGLRNVRLVEADAAEIDLPDASVDLVVSNLGINNFENAAAVLRNCFRLAKPGARLCLTTNLTGHMQEFYEVYRETLAELGMQECWPALDEHIAHRGTVDSVRRLLAGAGFEVLTVRTEAFRLRYADGSALLRHHFIRLGFLPAWKGVVPEEKTAAVFAALERNLDRRAAERGELALTIPMAYFEARRPPA